MLIVPADYLQLCKEKKKDNYQIAPSNGFRIYQRKLN